MKNQDFEGFVTKERERLTALKEELTTKIEELNKELETASRSLLALDAYQAAKEGKLATPRAPRKTTGTRAPRDGSMRGTVLSMLEKEPLGRAELIAQLGIKGDKKKEQNLSNLLTNLKKAGKVNNKDGTYSLAA